MFNRKIFNAIYIKQKTLMTSVAIQLCIFLLLLLSIILSFFPWIRGILTSEEPLKISITGFAFEDGEFDNVMISDEEPDALLSYSTMTQEYTISLINEKAKKALSLLENIVYEQNIRRLMQYNDLTREEMMLIQNKNITVDDQTDYLLLDEDQNLFMMAIVLMYFIMTTVLISRIGAQVAHEKGNQLTEMILTSLTRSQLFVADMISSFLVTVINVMIISVPIIIAAIINNSKITSNFLFLDGMVTFWMLVHLGLCSFSLIILCIGLCSLVKHAEDSNAFSTLMLLPVMVSYIYTIWNKNLFDGIWIFLNYIPLFSIFPILAGIITSSISSQQMIIYIIVDLLFIAFEVYLVRFIYLSHISKT